MTDTIAQRILNRDAHYIDGQWIPGEGGTREVVNPADGRPFATVAEGTAAQADQAIAAAKRAQGHWGALAPLERAAIMQRVAEIIRREQDGLARTITREEGKPLSEAMGEASGAAEFFDFFAGFARRIQGEILPSDVAGEQVWIQRVPIGVVGAIIPWNYPAALVSRKVAPAMIAGDTVVLKPHEITPLSALYMAHIFEEAGVPAGVVNVVLGAGETVGAAISASKDVDLVTMTGSLRAGRAIAQAAASNLVPVSLELGGKAPFIVMEDADLDMAVQAAITSRFMNCGQVCICNERMLIHEKVHDAFMERFVAATRDLRVGDPLDPGTDIGPKVSATERDKVAAMIADTVSRGGELLLPGGVPEQPPVEGGFWMSPTVMTNVTPDMPIMRQEIFGPVVPAMKVGSFEEAVAVANDSEYGLSAYLFTNDFRRVMRAVSEVRFGEIYVNRIGPESLQGFHVGMRGSGLGGDDGVHGLEAYLQKKTVYANWSGRHATDMMPWAT